MRIRQKLATPMMRPITRVTPSSLQTLDKKKAQSSKDRVRAWRMRQALKPEYDHEKEKEATRIRVAAHRASTPKCPLGRYCKDESCKLHRDRGKPRKSRIKKPTRKEAARLIRRTRLRDNRSEKDTLVVKIASLTNENRRMKRKLERTVSEGAAESTLNDAQNSENESTDSDEVGCSSFIIQNMTPNSKRKTFKRMALAPGFSPAKAKLRKENVRFHKCRLFQPVSSHVTDVGEKIIAFMISDDNSFQCPDKKKKNIRFRKDTLEVLHEKFMSEENVDCSYRHFCRNIPDLVVKPKPEDWGTSLCKICLNPEMKVRGLNTSNKKESSVILETLIALEANELKEFEERLLTDDLVTYKEWQREPVRKKKSSKKGDEQLKKVVVSAKTYRSVKVVVTEKSKDFVKKLLIEIEQLKAHNERKISQFRQIKAMHKIVDDWENQAAMIRMDWSENATLFQCEQEKSAYYHDVQVSVNTAVVYTADRTRCVGSLSDNTKHGAAAVWTSLKSMIEGIELDVHDLRQLFIITDSPTSLD